MSLNKITIKISKYNILAILTSLFLIGFYIIKNLLIFSNPNLAIELGYVPNRIIFNKINWEVYYKSLFLSVIGTIIFLIIVKFILKRNRVFKIKDYKYFNNRTWWNLFGFTFILSVISLMISYKYDVGLMSIIPKETLPFKIAGILYYLRTIVLTGIIIMLSYDAICSRNRINFLFAITLLIINGFLDSILRTSKLSLFLPLISIFVLLIISDLKFNKSKIIIFFVLLVLILFIYPYINYLRIQRISGISLIESLITITNITPSISLEFVKNIFISLIFRIPSTELLYFIQLLIRDSEPVSFFKILSSTNGVSGYLTNSLFQIPSHTPHLIAPGYFGWWFILFGFYGVIFGVSILAICVSLVWNLILHSNLYSAPVIRVFYFIFIILVITDGAIDLQLKGLLAMCFTVIMIELFYRFFGRRSSN
jgi:hypothetical protein